MPFRSSSVAIRFLGVVLVLWMTACGGGSSSPTLPTAAPSPTPFSGQHLYAASNGTNHTPLRIFQFVLPLTSTSMPTATLAPPPNTPLVEALAIDSAGNLAAADNGGYISIFRAPISDSSTAFLTFKNGSAVDDGQLVFDNSDDLFAATTSATVNLFARPLSSLSTVSKSITDPALTYVFGAAFDSSNNLIVSNCKLGALDCNLMVFAPPYDKVLLATPFVTGSTYGRLALNTNQLFVSSNTSGTNGRVDVYNLPLSASSEPAFSIAAVSAPKALALDNSGNLYVANDGDATVRVFMPPFSASSNPGVVLSLPTPTFGMFALAVGK